MDPSIKLNTDGSAIGNLGLASVAGILCDSSGLVAFKIFVKFGHSNQ